MTTGSTPDSSVTVTPCYMVRVTAPLLNLTQWHTNCIRIVYMRCGPVVPSVETSIQQLERENVLTCTGKQICWTSRNMFPKQQTELFLQRSTRFEALNCAFSLQFSKVNTAYACVCMCACVRACVRVCVSTCVHACVCDACRLIMHFCDI